MGYKTLELTLISAKDLKNVSMIGKMDVYVVVSISGDPGSKQKTPTHQDGGTSPCWNHTLRFTFDEATATYSGWEVVCVLKHDAFGPDKDLGEVRAPIKDLVSSYQGKKDAEFLTYQVKSKSSGKAKGELKISYKLKDAADIQKGAPAAAYPAHSASGSGAAYAYPPPPHAASGSGAAYPYPPPPQAAAYAYPAAPGYPPAQAGYPQYRGGYPPQQPVPGAYGYGYPAQAGYPVQQQAPKRGGGSGLAMGLGAGLIGGAVGGLLIGDMVDDSFDCDGDF